MSSMQQKESDPMLQGFGQFRKGDPVDPRWIPRMAELAQSHNPDDQARGMNLLERLLGLESNASTVSAVIETGVLDSLVQVMKSEQAKAFVQADACAILASLNLKAKGDELLLMKNWGVFPAAVSLLKATTDLRCLQCSAWLLGNCWRDYYLDQAQTLPLDILPTLRRLLLEAPWVTNWVKEWVGWLLRQTLCRSYLRPISLGYAQQAAELCIVVLTRESLTNAVKETMFITLSYAVMDLGGEEWLFSNWSLLEPIFRLRKLPFPSVAVSREQVVKEFVDLFHHFVENALRLDEAVDCLIDLTTHGHWFLTAIGMNSRLMTATANGFCGCFTSHKGRHGVLRLTSAVLLRAGSECLSHLVSDCELLDAIARGLPSCVEPDVVQLMEDVLNLLFHAVFAIAEDSNSAVLDMLLTSLRSSLRKPIAAFREQAATAKSFDRIWNLYFDQASPSYFKVVHRKRLVRYAIPNELVSATDITDHIGSFLSLSQLHKELHLCSDEEFPPCCRMTNESKAGGKLETRKRERHTAEG